VHEGLTPYKCTLCPMGFAFPKSLGKHMDTEHVSLISWEFFSLMKIILQGIQEEGGAEDHDPKKVGTYACDLCDKRFNHLSSVFYHKEAEHNDGIRFACNKCEKSFKHRQLLQRHQLVHTEDR